MNGASPGGTRLASLVARIRKLYYVEAGQPSYPMLSREADRIIAEADDEESDWLRPLPRATACDLISGKSKRTPDWLLVRMLVVVCHRIATKSNLDIASQGTLVKESVSSGEQRKRTRKVVYPPRRRTRRCMIAAKNSRATKSQVMSWNRLPEKALRGEPHRGMNAFPAVGGGWAVGDLGRLRMEMLKLPTR